MTPTIGTVISGTMRPEDLIPTFLNLTEELGLSVDTMLQYDTLPEGYYESDDAMYDLDRLFDALDSVAPEGCYFGAHPGDGDYGFWRWKDWELAYPNLTEILNKLSASFPLQSL